MGKRLRQQRAGRATPTFISPSWRKIAPAKYPSWLHELIKGNKVVGKIIDIIPESGRDAPLCLIEVSQEKQFYSVAPEGVYLGDLIEIGESVPIKVGNICKVGNLPEGTIICNIERRPGDGGKFVRAAGSYSTVSSQTPNGTVIMLPSGKFIEISKECLATIGVVAAGGKTEKPLLKAGKSYHKYKAKARKWPTVRGKAMYAAAHPHGGGSHPKGGRVVKKSSPPGKKVGLYGSRRTGRRKG